MPNAFDDDNYGAPIIMIEFGVRSVLNFIGMAMLIIGVWHVDRTWDEKGSAAYKRVEEKNNKDNQEFSSSDEVTITIPKEDLDAAFPFPWAFILGWILCGISHLFKGNELNVTAPAILSLVFSVLLGGIASVPMGDAVRNRKAKKKKMLGLSFLLSWICLALFTGFKDNFVARNGGLPFAFCFVGAFTVILSMKLLWKYRKMGTSWEADAKPNPDPVVYNMGGPLFILGFVLFWIGMAQTDTPDNTGWFLKNCRTESCGLPIFLNVRTLLAWFAGVGMVPVVMFMDCAHDNGNEFTGGFFFGIGTDGKSFGRFLESPALFLIHWTLFGLCGFIDTDNTFSLVGEARVWVVFVACVLQGIVAGILIQSSLYKRDLAGKQKWSKPFLLLFIVVAVDVGLSADYNGLNAGGLALGFCLFGAIFVVMGQKTVFGDRIRGDYWMEHDQPNPNPVVYSAGEPLFMFGWILVAMAMSYSY